ncbi:Hypothetical predicted protein [Olea europaea subsp. europaea]|uniref:Uncharacterized protein n=1 Tax=Olea europaea subsp. europaea TaxID=158383 RepID=A0A8S0R4I0_OLEEU|nr:Hypothetical predicted protein [Olea europaea subsp. europaea]
MAADAPGNYDFGHGGGFKRMEFEDDDYEDGNDNNNGQREGDMELDPELDSLTRRRSSAAVIQLLHGIVKRMVSELGNSERDQRDTYRNDIRDG